ncbi:MAG: site-specific integrase [Clostridia bacterium]|nr:site-specific integrase [Clostridia bacterium]
MNIRLFYRLFYSKLTGVYEKSPKTKTSVRDIPIPTELLEELRKYREWFRLADDNFDDKHDQYYLAVGIDRQPLYPQTVGNFLHRLEQRNGLKNVTCHGLRHTYCSLLLSQNVPIQTVSKYMGHSDSTITLKVYSHFIPDTQERVIVALDNITNKK